MRAAHSAAALTVNTLKTPMAKKYLEDVVYLRLILIFLLIWTHAFSPYTGAWQRIQGVEEIPSYYWIGFFIHYMRMQALVFISGYLLGYTSLRKDDALSARSCVVKKLRRLILPSLVFSVAYFWLLSRHDVSLPTAVYSIVNGCGHLWFLPMLFWCFLLVFVAEKVKAPPALVVALGVLAALLPVPELPLRLNRTMAFFIYFYMGFGLKRGYLDCLQPRRTLWPILACLGIYVAGFFVETWHLAHPLMQGHESFLARAVNICATNLLTLCMSAAGLLGAYWAIHRWAVGRVKLKNWMIVGSTYCYGVYICQQFILQWLYYHTSLPQAVGAAALPWIAIAITLAFSLLITRLMLQTRAGRYLIG